MSNELGNTPEDKNHKPSGIVNDLDEGQIKAVQLTDGTYITEKLAKSMTKAESFAMQYGYYDKEKKRACCVGYNAGYHQAEKDLEWEVNHPEEAYMKGVQDGLKERLTWEDAQLLHIITEKYMRELDNRIEAFPSSSQELFEEILRRFYEKKK